MNKFNEVMIADGVDEFKRDEIIKKLKEENEKLKSENKVLKYTLNKVQKIIKEE
jgi:hypothetical protein